MANSEEAGDASSSSTKRRRDIDSDNQPKKKQRAENQTLRFSAVSSNDEWQPVVVTTPGLRYNGKEALQAYKNGKELLLSVSSHPKLDYVAREEASGGSESLLKHYLGIYDPETGKVEIVPAKQLVMRTKLHNTRSLEDDVEAVLPKAGNARQMLGEAFGTKKSKKALSDLAQNSIRSAQTQRTEDGKLVLDNMASAVLDTMDSVTGIMTTQAVLQQQSDEKKPRPKMNLEAKESRDVFSLDDVIGNEILKLLDTRPWLADVKADRPVESHSAFVARRIVRVMSDGDSLKDTKKDKILRYYQALHDWTRCLQKGARTGWKVPKREEVQESVKGVNERVIDQMRKKFAPDNTLNRWSQGYLITHLCALALFIDDFEVDMTDLEIDTGLERAPLTKYFAELGCQTKKMTESKRLKLNIPKLQADQRRVAIMKIPLQFPKLRAPRRAR